MRAASAGFCAIMRGLAREFRIDYCFSRKRRAQWPEPTSNPPRTEEAVVTRAVMRAAARLGLPTRRSRECSASQKRACREWGRRLPAQSGDKSFELALFFLRLFRLLDAIAGGDELTARALRNNNLVLGGVPAAMIESVPGLVNVVGYLDARRALV